MKLKSRDKEKIKNNRLFYDLKILNIYKEKYWSKKLWK